WKSAGLDNKGKSAAKKLLDQITENFEVKNESEIDAVTAISGSGPAYFFYLAQAMYQGALDIGLNEVTSRKLVEKTFAASAVLQDNRDYKELINQVRSKK